MAEFLMPSLGADMDEGTLVEWLVAPGDEVQRGQLVAVVDTDKADIEVEVFEAGRVAELLVEPGTTVAVGTPLARIEPAGGVERPPTAPAAPAAPEEPAAPAEPPGAPAPRVTSPLVRRLAEHDHVELSALHGSGPGGTITRHDVEEAAHAGEPVHAEAPAREDQHGHVRASPYARRLAEERGIDLQGRQGRGPGGAVVAADVPAGADRHGADRQRAMRQAIAEVLSRSKREIPHYYLSNTVDLHRAMTWLDERNADRPPAERVLPAALLLKATALAAREVPQLNGTWEEGGFRPAPSVNLGVAVSLRGGGLLAPSIPDADGLDLEALMAALSDLVARTRAGTLRRTELTSGTITVTNLGDRGVDSVHGIIQPPQVGLVGFGRIAERPWAVDGMLAVRPVVVTTLAADHRASDGHTGARLLGVLDRLLQDPDRL